PSYVTIRRSYFLTSCGMRSRAFPGFEACADGRVTSSQEMPGQCSLSSLLRKRKRYSGNLSSSGLLTGRVATPQRRPEGLRDVLLASGRIRQPLPRKWLQRGLRTSGSAYNLGIGAFGSGASPRRTGGGGCATW